MPRPEHDRAAPDYCAYLAAYPRVLLRFRAEPTAHHAALLLTGERILHREHAKPGRFELGRTVATPGALAAMDVAGVVAPVQCGEPHGAAGGPCMSRAVASGV